MIRKRIPIDIERFRKFRERRGVSINEIADKMGVGRRIIYNWISNGWPDDNPSRFTELSEILQVPRLGLFAFIKKKMH